MSLLKKRKKSLKCHCVPIVTVMFANLYQISVPVSFRSKVMAVILKFKMAANSLIGPPQQCNVLIQHTEIPIYVQKLALLSDVNISSNFIHTFTPLQQHMNKEMLTCMVYRQPTRRRK